MVTCKYKQEQDSEERCSEHVFRTTKASLFFRLKIVHTVLGLLRIVFVWKKCIYFFLIIKKLQWIEKHSNFMCMHSICCGTVYSSSDIVHYHYVPCTFQYIIIRVCNLCGWNPFLTLYACVI